MYSKYSNRKLTSLTLLKKLYKTKYIEKRGRTLTFVLELYNNSTIVRARRGILAL